MNGTNHLRSGLLGRGARAKWARIERLDALARVPRESGRKPVTRAVRTSPLMQLRFERT